ncbi:MAG: hypothetical protein JNL70_11810 [Saprospiraceae bacterium]|nr:hypothetical protein [Saprospiraceae bacterium]
MKRKLLTTHTTLVGTVFISLFLVFTHQMGLSQAVNNQIKDVVMPSANAASLGKYGDIPVSLHTGVTNVSIPIHTISDGTISLPISLSYHSGGVKVGEPCSWVGQNWSLQAGGMISRSVQGKADERINGYMTIGKYVTVVNQPVTLNPNNTCIKYTDPTYTYGDGQFSTEITNGEKDSEPDIFSFSVGGYNGKFYIEADMTDDGQINGKVVLVPKQDVKVEYELDGSGSNIKRLKKFTITTPDGTKYEFGAVDTDINDGIEVTKPLNAQVDQYVTGWYLRKITTADRKHSISLAYTPEKYRNSARASIGGSVGNLIATLSGNYAESVTDIIGYRLASISNATNSEIITFVANEVREDLKVMPNQENYRAKRLNEIKIESGTTVCKKFVLTQGYFVDNTTNYTNQETDKRLRLEAIQEKSCNTSLQSEPYILTYYTQNNNPNYLPNRLSSAIDHWGYFNGANSNPTAGLNIPFTRLRYNSYGGTSIDVNKGASNRETNEESMILGSLKEIKYPTGGTSTFEYQANDYWETDIKNMVNDGNLVELAWVNGHFSENSGSREISTTFYKTFDDIDNSFIIWNYKKAYNYSPSAADISNNPSNVTIDVYQGNSSTPLITKSVSNSANDKIINNITDKLLYLFPGLQNNVQYRFVLRLTNAASQIQFQKEISATPINKKVGGLRIAKITSYDGINTTNNVVKTYSYRQSGGSMSSAKLYRKPIYGYVFNNVIGACNPEINTNGQQFINHYFQDISLVPLTSFEGYHIGYGLVTETINGFATQYAYELEEVEVFNGLPTVPEQPRIGTGELKNKTLIDNNYQIVSEESYTAKNDIYETGQGTYIKSNSFTFGNAGSSGSIDAPATVTTTTTFEIVAIGGVCCFTRNHLTATEVSFNGTPPSTLPQPPISITFWKKYSIRTRPYRLSEVKSKIDGVETRTNYTYDSQNRFLAPTEITVTNSEGKEHKTKNYYAKNLLSTHPNYDNIPAYNNVSELNVSPNGLSTLLFQHIIGVPLQTEVYINNVKVGGSILKYNVFEMPSSGQPAFKHTNAVILPHKSYSINQDGTTKLNVTVDAYDRGLPSQMTKEGFTTPQIFSWDSKKRLTQKQFGSLMSFFEYEGTSNLVNKITDENGVRTKFDYDPLQRLWHSYARVDANFNNPRITTTYQYNYSSTGTPCNSVGSTTTYADNTAPLSSVQFLDGLGRSFASVKKQYTPSNLDQLSFMTYDNVGRPNLTYQPKEISLSGCPTEPTGTPSVQPTYENSPLSRVLEQKAEDGKTVKTLYSANTKSANPAYNTDLTKDDVRKFTVAPTVVGGDQLVDITYDGYYYDNLLYKTSLWNENGTTTKPAATDWLSFYVGRTDVFKDKLGRVLLTRKFVKDSKGDWQRIDTYNVYDDYGNLVAVIQPDGINTNNVLQYDLVFQYRYDNRNRLIEKKVPGAKRQCFYYDNRDLMVLMQDGNMRVPESNGQTKYIATLYDNLGRVRYTAMVYSNIVGSDPAAYALTLNESSINAMAMLTETRYEASRNLPYFTQQQMSNQKPTEGRYTWMWYSYDDYGRLVNRGGTHILQQSGGKYTERNDADQVVYDYMTVYEAGGGRHGSYIPYTYDNGHRLKTAKFQQILGSNWVGTAEPLFENNYNYKDQLVEKNVSKPSNTTKWLQSIDYQYNVRGWLTAINQMDLSRYNQVVLTNNGVQSVHYGHTQLWNLYGNDDNVDLFGERINYSSTLDPNLTAPPQYNGNISQTMWQVAGREKQAYTYTYDELDRLTNATYTDIHETESPYYFPGDPVYATDNKFGEQIAYDNRGNIASLVRNGLIDPCLSQATGVVCGTFGQIDNLVYDYTDANNKNRLMRVTDYSNKDRGFKYPTGGTTGDTYTYDDNGNLTSDKNKGITKISYNLFNMPILIEFGTTRKIEFLYDPSGHKLRKTVTENNVIIDERYYIEEIEINKDGQGDYIRHTEGGLRRGTDGVWRHEFVLRDHLGNTRTTYTDLNSDGTIDPNTEMSQINHYYPFGLNMEGNWNGAAGANKYQYNGKEWNDDFGLGWNDYGARFYDPSVSRWLAVDPMTESQEGWSPYHYVYGNPTKNTDPDGKMPDSDPPSGGCCGNIGTRVLGGLRAVGGVIQMTAGVGLALVPEPTFLTKAGAVVALGHGGDDVQAGIRQMWTGESTESLTYDVTKKTAQALGANEQNASRIATGTDMSLSLVGGGAGAVKTGEMAITNAAEKAVVKAVAAPVNTTRELAAAARNPALAPMMKGKGVDRAFRQHAANSTTLNIAQKLGILKVNPTNKGADMIGKGVLKGTWWDVTTPSQWRPHVQKYGPGGIPLTY